MGNKWVCGWGCAVNYTSASMFGHFEDVTLRYVIYSSVDCEGIRIHFSNRYSNEDATVDKLFAAPVIKNGEVDPAKAVVLTVNGKTSFTIPAHGEVVTDAALISVPCGSEFAVSMYFKNSTPYETGANLSGECIRKYYSHGDHAADSIFEPSVSGGAPAYLFMYEIDFLCGDDCAAIVAFGDSITARPWPDFLARRLVAMGIKNRTVVRKGIGGNRLLKNYPQFARNSLQHGYAGITRFEKDTSCAGADRVFMLEGINDLFHPGRYKYCGNEELPTADELIAGYTECAAIAHTGGRKYYLSPVLPCPLIAGDDGEGEREQIRRTVNKWIREKAVQHGIIDGMIDFESAVSDITTKPYCMLAQFDDDSLHPNTDGSRAMAESIPEEYLRA